MIDLSDESVISARARLADRIAALLEADPRVRACVALEFAEGGGAQATVTLIASPDRIATAVIARELEFAVGTALADLPWIRVRVA
jgi:hypothetical protein